MLTEDGIVNWVRAQGGVLHTRKYSNLAQLDQYVNCKNFNVLYKDVLYYRL